ncbi:hypothetical protein ABK040_002941 [Willaertia magna]
MSLNLFAQASQTSGPKPLLQFKAGILHKTGNTVKPDNRKGKIALLISPEDQLLHLQWRDRKDSVLEDYILFPGDATFEKVEKVKDGRVYILKYTTGRELFFWMQEPKTDKDEEYQKKINEYINNPPNSDIQELLNEAMGEERSEEEQTTTQAPRSGNSVQLDQLQQIIQGINPQSTRQQGSSSSSNQNQEQALTDILRNLSQEKGLTLEHILSSDALCEAVKRHPSILEREDLFSHLPEGDNDRSFETLCSHLRSPQLHQAIDVFHMALSTGQLQGLMGSFGLNPSVADPLRGGGLLSFLNALQNKAEEEKKNDKKDDKKDDKMDESEDK